LFLLMLCIIWEGYWLIGKAEILTTARNDAWKKRFNNAADEPLIFPVLDDPVPLGLYHANKDFVTEKTTTQVKISPAFDSVPGPHASHTILAGAWDQEAMPLNKPPNFVLMGKAALVGGFGNILDLLSAASDPLGLIKKFSGAKREGDQNKSRTDQEASNVGEGGSSGNSGPGSGGGSGTGAGGDDGMTAEEAQKKAEADLEKQKLAVKKRFKELGGRINGRTITPVSGELDAAQDAVIATQLDSAQKSEAALRETNEENRKKLQEEAARANRKYELAKITFERLKAECLSVVDEANGLGIEQFELNMLLGAFL
jgi:hypothetical protein